MDPTKILDKSVLISILVVFALLILANIGTIGAVWWASLKITWKASEMNTDIAENKKDVNAAHALIREDRRKFNEFYRDEWVAYLKER